MSDRNEKRSTWGNLNRQPRLERQGDANISRYPSRRPLVEEALSVNTQDLRRIHGREKLLRAADEGNPISVQLGGNAFQVFLTWDAHRLPGRACRWSDVSQGNARIWLVCDSCRRKVRILYKSPLSPASGLPPLGCRRCLYLVYASENSCKTIWWKRIVKPIRRLCRRRKILFTRKRTRRVIEELNQIEGLIFIYIQRARKKPIPPKNRSRKRLYKDVDLILGNQEKRDFPRPFSCTS
jgi:hypothetical protein